MSAGARTLRKILVSLGIGATAYLLTNVLTDMLDTPGLEALTLSVVLGGVSFVAQFLIEFERRLVGVETGLTKVNAATELFGLIEASALRTDAVLQLIQHSTQIDPTSPPLILRFAQAEIGRMSEFLKELGSGSNVSYEGEDRDWMLSLARHAEDSIDATSLTTVDAGGKGFIDGGLWASDLGQRYLEVQREAIQRGVQVRRVFILDRPELATDPDFLAACQDQRHMGIQVRVLDSSAVPGIRRSSLFDFVLFDETISYEVTPASRLGEMARPTIVTTRLELQPLRVKDRIQRFKDLWESAREID